MPNDPTTDSLGDFVRRVRREKHLSLSDVSTQSARFGKRINASYVNRIENGLARRASADRLKALADGLGVPAGEVLARAAGVSPSGKSDDALELITRFNELSPERQEDVLNIVDLWYAERADSRYQREPALTQPIPNPLTERNRPCRIMVTPTTKARPKRP